MNSFISDYLQHLVARATPTGQTSGGAAAATSFLSSNFTDTKMVYLPLVFALMDIPISSLQSKLQHKFKSDGKRGINITVGSNTVIFKREIKDGQCKLENDIMVTHRYQKPNGEMSGKEE